MNRFNPPLWRRKPEKPKVIYRKVLQADGKPPLIIDKNTKKVIGIFSHVGEPNAGEHGVWVPVEGKKQLVSYRSIEAGLVYDKKARSTKELVEDRMD